MRAGLDVQTRVRNYESLDRLVADDMRFDDGIHIGLSNAAVPNSIGIDHDVGAMLTLIEAARLIRADLAFQSALGQLDLERAL